MTQPDWANTSTTTVHTVPGGASAVKPPMTWDQVGATASFNSSSFLRSSLALPLYLW